MTRVTTDRTFKTPVGLITVSIGDRDVNGWHDFTVYHDRRPIGVGQKPIGDTLVSTMIDAIVYAASEGRGADPYLWDLFDWGTYRQEARRAAALSRPVRGLRGQAATDPRDGTRAVRRKWAPYGAFARS